jgi:hypothetical protein
VVATVVDVVDDVVVVVVGATVVVASADVVGATVVTEAGWVPAIVTETCGAVEGALVELDVDCCPTGAVVEAWPVVDGRVSPPVPSSSPVNRTNATIPRTTATAPAASAISAPG